MILYKCKLNVKNFPCVELFIILNYSCKNFFDNFYYYYYYIEFVTR